MRKLTSNQEAWLRERFDSRFSADLMERKIYSHDVAAMDNLLPKMLPAIVPLISDPLIDYLRG